MPAERILLLYRLKAGVDRESFERWLRETEQPLVSRLEAIESYAVTRLEEPSVGERPLPYEYVEVLEVRSLEAYRAGVADNPEVAPFLAEWEEYVAEYVVVQGPVVSEVRKAGRP